MAWVDTADCWDTPDLGSGGLHTPPVMAAQLAIVERLGPGTSPKLKTWFSHPAKLLDNFQGTQDASFQCATLFLFLLSHIIPPPLPQGASKWSHQPKNKQRGRLIFAGVVQKIGLESIPGFLQIVDLGKICLQIKKKFFHLKASLTRMEDDQQRPQTYIPIGSSATVS